MPFYGAASMSPDHIVVNLSQCTVNGGSMWGEWTCGTKTHTHTHTHIYIHTHIKVNELSAVFSVLLLILASIHVFNTGGIGAYPKDSREWINLYPIRSATFFLSSIFKFYACRARTPAFAPACLLFPISLLVFYMWLLSSPQLCVYVLKRSIRSMCGRK